MHWIYLFRHGETDFNREQRFQGHLDIPLNDQGREQARTLIGPLRQLEIQCILSSDLIRAKETAQIVAQNLKVPVITTPGLREANLGGAQGLTAHEIEARFGKELVNQWKSPYLSDADVSYPGGESGNHVLQRVIQSLEQFIETAGHSRIGVATHGGVIRRVVRSLIDERTPFIPIPNGILYPLLYSPTQTAHWQLLEATPLSFGSNQVSDR